MNIYINTLIIINLLLILFIITTRHKINKKNFLAFHTIFILNENIDYIEEFIKYYIHIGFDHFYLYDNENSIGRNGSTSTMNKYGFKIDSKNSKNDTDKLQKILNKYKDKITYVSWQPKDKNNNIIYGWHEGITHFMKHYSKDNNWVAFMDFDEFIFSKNNINIRTFLQNKEKENVSCVKLIQKKFIDRNLSKKKLITQDFNCIDKKIGPGWGAKNIIKCKDYIGNTTSAPMHNFKVKNKTYTADRDEFRFNHYNINDKQLKWMKGFYKSPVDFTLNSIDKGMEQYKFLFTS